jgi:4-hydroxybenzoate polyprenyltransferase
MNKIKSYLSLIKFSHTIFAMPFALIGLSLGIIANPDIRRVPRNAGTHGLYNAFYGNEYLVTGLLVILCMVFARSAAMAFNRYLDRRFDAKNPRTAVREIPQGIIRPRQVLAFTIGSSLLFLLACYFINTVCFYLSPVALIVILGYSYTKRFTALCHLVLGLGLSLAPIGAYLAVTGVFNLIPLLFSLAVLFWVSGFDIIYALQDVEFDRSQRLYSIPARKGRASGLHISELLHLLSALAVVTAGWLGGFGYLYWAGAVIFCGMLIYQHLLVKPDDLRKVNLAFMTANGVASVIFAVFVILDLFLY